MTQEVEAVFKLLRIALGREVNITLPNDINWEDVFALSLEQGVENLVYDGLLLLMRDHSDLSYGFESQGLESLKYKWIGYRVLAEQKYQVGTKTLSDLVSMYSKHGFSILLLKGYGLSLYYPVPSLRPTGDIDIVVERGNGVGAQLESDIIIQDEYGIKVTKSKVHRHSQYTFHNILVENHYNYCNINPFSVTVKSKKLESIFHSLSKEDRRRLELDGNIFFVPSPTFNALFLMWHMSSHFCTSKISLRQICDWRQFVVAEYQNVNWKYVNDIYVECGLADFANVINHIIVQYLGVDVSLFDFDKEVDTYIEDRIINDIFSINKYHNSISRILRYPSFKWKYKLLNLPHWWWMLLKRLVLHVFLKEETVEKIVE